MLDIRLKLAAQSKTFTGRRGGRRNWNRVEQQGRLACRPEAGAGVIRQVDVHEHVIIAVVLVNVNLSDHSAARSAARAALVVRPRFQFLPSSPPPVMVFQRSPPPHTPSCMRVGAAANATTLSPLSAPRGTPPAESRRGRRASSASSLPSASRAAFACG